MKICKYFGCERKHWAKGYCKLHYTRYLRHGDASVNKCGGNVSKLPEYKVWWNMNNRCYNKNRKDYKYYGGRGITVCDRWRVSFIAFIEDMGERPTNKHTLDRVDNNRNYTLDNCEWVTSARNCQHRSSTKLSMPKAQAIRKLYATMKYKQTELAKLFKVSSSTIRNIIYNRQWKEVVGNNSSMI